MRKIDFVTFAISSLFLTSFSPGTSVIIQSLYSLLETPLGTSVYQPASWKNIVIRFTVRTYKYIHIRKGVSWSIWATITKYHSMGRKCMLVAQPCLSLYGSMGCIAHWAPLSSDFSRQEYRSAQSLFPPGNLPDPGIEPDLPPCRQIFYCLSHQSSPGFI